MYIYVYMNYTYIYKDVNHSPFTTPFIAPIIIVVFCGLISCLYIVRKKMANIIFNSVLEINSKSRITYSNNNDGLIPKTEIEIITIDNR